MYPLITSIMTKRKDYHTVRTVPKFNGKFIETDAKQNRYPKHMFMTAHSTSFVTSQNPILSSFMTYHRICNKSNTTGATLGAGTAYPSVEPEFTPVFSVIRVSLSLNFCVVFCRFGRVSSKTKSSNTMTSAFVFFCLCGVWGLSE